MTNKHDIFDVVSLFDCECELSETKKNKVIFWSSYNEYDDVISLPKYLDDKGDVFRPRYIKFIYSLGLQQYKGKSIIEELDSGNGISYWWMTQLAEKNPFKSPKIYDCLRLLALEDILKKRDVKELYLYCGDRIRAKSIQSICLKLNIKFHFIIHRNNDRKLKPRELYNYLPWKIRAIISLRHTIKRWCLRKFSDPGWFSGNKCIFLVSYFFNLDINKAERKIFFSRQWEYLPQKLIENGYKINWLHQLILTSEISTIGKAFGFIQGFNEKSYEEGCHSILESQLSAELVCHSLMDWWRVGKKAKYLWNNLNFVPEGSVVDLRYFLEDDWFNSLLGPAGLANVLWNRLFDRALSKIPHQSLGMYLWENQGWEVAFINAWRRHGHGKLIAVQHATICFWHLNNFEDSCIFELENIKLKPAADVLAINGPVALRMLTDAGFPAHKLEKVEALRFQYLDNKKSKIIKSNELIHKRVSIDLLLLGDLSRTQTLSMIDCLSKAINLLDIDINVTIKPHPACNITHAEVGFDRWQYTMKPLSEIINNYTFAFSSNSTSAAIDAVLSGMPVAIYLDGDSLNHSPLRGFEDIKFVSSSAELARFIMHPQSTRPLKAYQYFWLKNNLSGWNNLIERLNSTNRGI